MTSRRTSRSALKQPATIVLACVALAVAVPACGKSGSPDGGSSAAGGGDTSNGGSDTSGGGSSGKSGGSTGKAGSSAHSGDTGSAGDSNEAGAGGEVDSSSPNFQPAIVVIGQPDFTSNAAPTKPSAKNTDSPAGSAAFDGTRLFTPDTSTHRVLGFSSVPTANGAAAKVVLGQASLTSGDTGTTAASTYLPQSLHANSKTLAVADAGNHRVLLFPTTAASGASASVIVGWPDAATPSEGCAADRLRSPAAAFLAGNRLLVADRGNHRVLIWDQLPTANGVAADHVLGQTTLSSCVSNDSSHQGISAVRSAGTLSSPTDVWSDGKRVIVADRDNNRVLVWSQFPSDDGVAADVVIGQTDFDLARDAASASGLLQPAAVTFGNGRLYIADAGHNRVLGYPGIPTENGASADLVLGQNSFTRAAANDDAQTGSDGDGPTARTLSYPSGVAVTNDALIVSDTLNQRVLIYRAP